MQIGTLLQTTRPPFLFLTIACVFLGVATSMLTRQGFNTTHVILVLLGALLAHVSVNTLNEYYDFKSGLDLKTTKTPFSGGSGSLPKNPEMTKPVFILGHISLFLVITVGLYFVVNIGYKILPIGIMGIIIILTYTIWLNHNPFLCLIAPGTGFGILMLTGTNLVLTNQYTVTPWLISLIPFFLINNILLLNQYPDIQADTSVGRKTFPIVYGTTISNVVYFIFMASAFLLILLYASLDIIPELSYIALLPIVFSIYALVGAIKYSASIGQHSRYLAANVITGILTPFLLVYGLIAG